MNGKQLTAEEKSAIRELLRAGFSQKEIGRVLNRSQPTICYNIKRNNGESQVIENGIRKRISVKKMEEYQLYHYKEENVNLDEFAEFINARRIL